MKVKQSSKGAGKCLTVNCLQQQQRKLNRELRYQLRALLQDGVYLAAPLLTRDVSTPWRAFRWQTTGRRRPIELFRSLFQRRDQTI